MFRHPPAFFHAPPPTALRLVRSARDPRVTGGRVRAIEPFYHWHTPIAWTAYILLADAIVWKRRGNSWIRNSRSELLFVIVRIRAAVGPVRDVQQVLDLQLVLHRAARSCVWFAIWAMSGRSPRSLRRFFKPPISCPAFATGAPVRRELKHRRRSDSARCLDDGRRGRASWF